MREGSGALSGLFSAKKEKRSASITADDNDDTTTDDAVDLSNKRIATAAALTPQTTPRPTGKAPRPAALRDTNSPSNSPSKLSKRKQQDLAPTQGKENSSVSSKASGDVVTPVVKRSKQRRSERTPIKSP